jgi:hypothetical protein
MLAGNKQPGLATHLVEFPGDRQAGKEMPAGSATRDGQDWNCC